MQKKRKGCIPRLENGMHSSVFSAPCTSEKEKNKHQKKYRCSSAAGIPNKIGPLHASPGDGSLMQFVRKSIQHRPSESECPVEQRGKGKGFSKKILQRPENPISPDMCSIAQNRLQHALPCLLFLPC